MTKRTLALVAGFVVGGSGLYALILMLVRVQVTYLTWLDTWGALVGFVLRLLMIMGGAVLIVIGTTDWRRERAESEAYLRELSSGARRP